MGYKIEMINGLPEQTYDQDPTIATDMLLSALVPQGAWFFDPSFGLPELPKKSTPDSVELVRQRYEQAWQWLIDTGKAKSISVIAEPDMERGRVNVRAIAVQANDLVVPFEIFTEVI